MLRIITPAITRFSYFLLSLLVLQVLSLTIIAFLQYAIFNHMEASSAPVKNKEGIVYIYGIPIETRSSEKPNDTFVTSGLWTALAIVITLIIFYLSNISSKLLKYTLRKRYHRVTITNLFAAKFIMPGIAYILISVFALLLPAIYLLMPFNLAITILCLLGFGLQYWHVHKYKIPASQIL